MARADAKKRARELAAEINNTGTHSAAVEGGHWKVRDTQTGGAIYSFPFSPGDIRSLRNTRAELRKMGVPVTTEREMRNPTATERRDKFHEAIAGHPTVDGVCPRCDQYFAGAAVIGTENHKAVRCPNCKAVSALADISPGEPLDPDTAAHRERNRDTRERMLAAIRGAGNPPRRKIAEELQAFGRRGEPMRVFPSTEACAVALRTFLEGFNNVTPWALDLFDAWMGVTAKTAGPPPETQEVKATVTTPVTEHGQRQREERIAAASRLLGAKLNPLLGELGLIKQPGKGKMGWSGSPLEVMRVAHHYSAEHKLVGEYEGSLAFPSFTEAADAWRRLSRGQGLAKNTLVALETLLDDLLTVPDTKRRWLELKVKYDVFPSTYDGEKERTEAKTALAIEDDVTEAVGLTADRVGDEEMATLKKTLRDATEALKERNAAIAEMKTEVGELTDRLDRQGEALHGALDERDAAQAERNDAITERNQAIRERDEAIQERDWAKGDADRAKATAGEFDREFFWRVLRRAGRRFDFDVTDENFRATIDLALDLATGDDE